MVSVVTNLSPGDYQKALQIRNQVFVQEQNVPLHIEVDEFEKSAQHFLVLVDGEPAGTGRLRVKDQYIKFERIATMNKFRGQGIGRHLMIEMMKVALSDYSKFTPYMNAQADAVGFYEKLGWVRVGDIFYEANIPHYGMTLGDT